MYEPGGWMTYDDHEMAYVIRLDMVFWRNFEQLT